MAAKVYSFLFSGLTRTIPFHEVGRGVGSQIRSISVTSCVSARYKRQLPEYPPGFEVPPQIYVSDGTVNGKVIEKPDFVQNEAKDPNSGKWLYSVLHLSYETFSTLNDRSRWIESSYPLKVPHPEVAPEVAEILYKTRTLYLDGRKIWPSIKENVAKNLKTYYIARGFYWPEEPERSLALIKQKPRLTEKRREARKKLIEEKMKEMPRLIAEYRERVKERRLKRTAEKEKNRQIVLEAKRRGINPKHAQAMAHLKVEGKQRTKVVSTKKGYRRKTQKAQ